MKNFTNNRKNYNKIFAAIYNIFKRCRLDGNNTKFLIYVLIMLVLEIYFEAIKPIFVLLV